MQLGKYVMQRLRMHLRFNMMMQRMKLILTVMMQRMKLSLNVMMRRMKIMLYYVCCAVQRLETACACCITFALPHIMMNCV